MGTLRYDIGAKYINCRLHNYVCVCDAQRQVLERLKQFRYSISSHLANGTNLIFYGPPGTGKDHLLVGLLAEAIGQLRFTTQGRPTRYYPSYAQRSLAWHDGSRLFGAIRDRIATNEPYGDIVRGAIHVDLLALSDPLPGGGTLTAHQREVLFQIVDGRYRDSRPTWTTLNVNGFSELAEGIGPQSADRLRDNAVALECRWPSYRALLQSTTTNSERKTA